MADLRARHQRDAAAVETGVLDVLRSGRWIGGPIVADAEAAAAQMFGRAGAVGVSSGTDALALALQAAGVRPGDEVLVAALTFFATAGAVVAIGAEPVAVDVDDRGLIDAHDVRRARGPRTRAVVPVHLFGNAAPALDDLPVVDDLAQCAGSRPPPGKGLLGAVSCYPTKVWGAAGDAGFVVSDDLERLDAVRALGNHGLSGVHHHEAVDGVHVGRNARLDAVQAAVLLGRREGLGAEIERRRTIAARYDERLPAGWPVRRDLGNPVPQYVVSLDAREAVAAALDVAGIDSVPLYPRALGAQPALRDRVRHRPTPVADACARRFLAIPCHGGLTDDDVDRVATAIVSATRRR